MNVSCLQLENKEEDGRHVVILFQDMLEVVTRDIMEGVEGQFAT